MTGLPRFKGVTVEFANGDKLIVPPLSLGQVELLQDKLTKFSGALDPESVALVIEATTMALTRNYPEITREKVKDELVDLANMEAVMLAVMDVSGLRRKEQELGEAGPGKQ